MGFVRFNQNNSGGSFDLNKTRGLTHYVIIEADSIDEAVDTAESIGIYFDGVDDDRDCECCGDRWYRPWKDDLTETPQVSDKSPEDYLSGKGSKYGVSKWMPEGFEIVVHYKDGRIEWF